MISFPRRLPFLFTFARGLRTSTALLKNNKPRLRVRSGLCSTGSSKDTSRRESVAQMRADASRAKWEAENAAAEKVKGLHPSSNQTVYFASAFERPQWFVRDAVAMLREAAAPEMFNCETNPLYAKVKLKQFSCFIYQILDHVML